MDGYLPVRVNVPLDDYRRLFLEAQASGITIAQRIAQTLATPSPKPHGRTGRPSAYTHEKGAEIASDRRMGRSWAAAGAEFGISDRSAKAWHEKYLNEVREQNMRDRAERSAS